MAPDSSGRHVLLGAIPRWLLLLIVAAAPWLYGGVPAWTASLLEASLGLLAALFAVSLVVRRLPRISPFPLLLSAAIFLLGWGLVLNAHARFDWLWFAFQSLPPPISALPGSWDARTSALWMIRCTGLLAAMGVSIDMAANPVWRRRTWLVLAANGVAVIALGLAQMATSAQASYWQADPSFTQYFVTFFAAFYADEPAGTFINITLPLVAGLFFLSLRGHPESPARAGWTLSLMLCLAAALLNTSRSATVVFAGLAVVLVAGFLRTEAPRWRLSSGRKLAVIGGCLATAAAFAVWQFQFGTLAARWSATVADLLHGNDTTGIHGRLLAVRACLQALPAAGAFGFGPGTFEITFPFFTSGLGPGFGGVWRHAHNDYLQMLMEWGWAGSALWALLVPGSALAAFLTLRKSAPRWPLDLQIYTAMLILALAGQLLHAFADYPFQVFSLQLLAAVITGQLWGIAALSRGERPPADTSSA